MNDYEARRLIAAVQSIERLAALIWMEASLIRRGKTTIPDFAELDKMLSAPDVPDVRDVPDQPDKPRELTCCEDCPKADTCPAAE